MLEFKYRPLAKRTHQVPRDALLEQVGSINDIPNLAILAPAGYGKTTLMSQLEEADKRKTAWLTLDESDGDPATLLTSLANSLVTADLIDEQDLRALSTWRSDTVLTHGINELWSALDGSELCALYLDQIDHLTTRNSRDIVGGAMTRHPENLQIVIASRSGDGLPLPLLRSRGEITELAMTDLAMTVSEAEGMLKAVGVDSPADLDQVIQRTEGWPVAIYLMALALKSGTFAPDSAELRGDDIFLADYLRHELLAHTPDEAMDFMQRTSILDRLSGPLCDHVIDGEDSAEMLNRLEKASLLVIPLDRTRTWYRYHGLLRDLLRSELENDQPGEVPTLHGRAADWLAENGFEDLAIEHAMAARDTARFGEMVMSLARRVYAEGRVGTLTKWWSWMENTGAVIDLPELTAMAGFFRGMDGDAAGSEAMGAYVFTDGNGSQKPDEQLGPFALLLRATQATKGVEQSMADGRAALEVFGPNSEWHHACLGVEAMAITMTEGIQAAESVRAEGLMRSHAIEGRPSSSQALAQRALAAIDRNDWETAEEFIGQSLEAIKKGHLEGYITSALGFTLAARIEARHGNIDAARNLLASAAALRPRLSPATPLLSVQSLHEMAKTFIELADIAGARRVMREAADIIALRPRLGTLITDHDDLKSKLSELPAGAVGSSSLTKAELRVLPMLVTHLTFPEIGDRLYVSRHTVKAHAMSIYRKLGVSSRSDAVAKAREMGLISL